VQPDPPRSISIEERLGQNWLNKLGIITLVIGVALFLGYKLGTLGPLGKSLLGLTLSLTLLGGGLVLERRSKYRIFARAGIGGGWALTFFVTFALYHVDAMRVLPSQGIDLVLMMIVASAMVLHSLHYKSQVVTSLAFLLAFVTVGISEVTLFSLVAGALLAAGLVYVAAREYWFRLGIAGLVGVYVNHYLWLHRVLPQGGQLGHPFPQFLPSLGLLLFYWLLFRLLYVLRVPRDRDEEIESSFGAILNSIGMMSLLKFQSSHPEWAFWGLLCLGAAELVLAFVARRRWRTAFIVLSSISSILLLAAIPFRFGGSNWSLLWLLEAEILFVAGVRIPENVFRRLGILAGFAALIQLVATGVVPIFNDRQLQADASSHLPVTIALLVAAGLFWFNSEFGLRRWTSLFAEDVDQAALRITSYLALLAAACGLWVGIPGVWTAVAWLLTALALAWAADKLKSSDFATQSDLLAVGAIVRAVFINLSSDQHWGRVSLRAVSVTFAAALLYLLTQRKTRARAFEIDYIPTVYSWAATGMVGAVLWYELPSADIAVAWVIFGVILAWLSDRFESSDLATQADVLAVGAVGMVLSVNLFVTTRWHGLSVRAISVGFVAALLYASMRRKIRAYGVVADYLPSSYSWAASGLLGALLWYELQPISVAVAWAIFGLILFELGVGFKRDFLRHQGYTLFAASFVRMFFANLDASASTHLLSPSVFTVVPMIGAYLWIYERARADFPESRFDQLAAVSAAWAGTIAASTLLYFVVRVEWVVIAWACLALVLVLVGWVLKRTLFVAQSLVLLIATVVRAVMFNILTPASLASSFQSSRIFCIGAACGLMLLSLPMAFGVRRQSADRAENSNDNWAQLALLRPEQAFFFVPLVLTAVLLALELRAGMITVGWSALGVAAFLFALTVGERSFRLAGLSLLLLGLGKIIFVDIWHATPSDRYITLIVTGAALLLVSFLYSRYRESILKFL